MRQRRLQPLTPEQQRQAEEVWPAAVKAARKALWKMGLSEDLFRHVDVEHVAWRGVHRLVTYPRPDHVSRDTAIAVHMRCAVIDEIRELFGSRPNGKPRKRSEVLLGTEAATWPHVPPEETCDQVDFEDEAEYVRGLIASLPSEHRQVMTLRFVEGCPGDKVAQRLRIKESRVWEISRESISILRSKVARSAHACGCR